MTGLEQLGQSHKIRTGADLALNCRSMLSKRKSDLMKVGCV
jgi:hypothetical protein